MTSPFRDYLTDMAVRAHQAGLTAQQVQEMPTAELRRVLAAQPGRSYIGGQEDAPDARKDAPAALRPVCP
jgi:hypothetical protein